MKETRKRCSIFVQGSPLLSLHHKIRTKMFLRFLCSTATLTEMMLLYLDLQSSSKNSLLRKGNMHKSECSLFSHNYSISDPSSTRSANRLLSSIQSINVFRLMEYQNLRGGRIVLADVKVRVQIQSLHFICLRKFRLFVTFCHSHSSSSPKQ